MTMKRFISGLIPFLFLIVFCACSNNGKIIEAYDRGDFNTVKELCNPRADKDDPKCLYLLGRMFTEGNGVVINDENALKYLSKAADLGHHYAQYYLGSSLLQGVFKGKSTDEAMDYIHKAAKAGLPEAQFLYYSAKKTFERLSEENKISDEEEKEINLFLEKSADKGNVDSLMTLAVRYCVPVSTQPECETKGIPMMEKAAESSLVNPLRSLGLLRYSRQEFDKSVEPLKQAAMQGDGEAAFFLGRIYIAGRGNEDGYKWMKVAAESGNEMALEQLKSFSNPNLRDVLIEGEKRYEQVAKSIRYNKMIEQRRATERNIGKEFLDKF